MPNAQPDTPREMKWWSRLVAPLGLVCCIAGLALFAFGWMTARHAPLELMLACGPGFGLFLVGTKFVI